MSSEIFHILRDASESLENEEENTLEQLQIALDTIKSLTEACFREVVSLEGYGSVETERAKYWHSSIMTSLDKDHSYLGGCMFTLQDSVNLFDKDYEDEDEEDEEDEEDNDD